MDKTLKQGGDNKDGHINEDQLYNQICASKLNDDEKEQVIAHFRQCTACLLNFKEDMGVKFISNCVKYNKEEKIIDAISNYPESIKRAIIKGRNRIYNIISEIIQRSC